jgi:hypothetical protein
VLVLRHQSGSACSTVGVGQAPPRGQGRQVPPGCRLNSALALHASQDRPSLLTWVPAAQGATVMLTPRGASTAEEAARVHVTCSGYVVPTRPCGVELKAATPSAVTAWLFSSVSRVASLTATPPRGAPVARVQVADEVAAVEA